MNRSDSNLDTKKYFPNIAIYFVILLVVLLASNWGQVKNNTVSQNYALNSSLTNRTKPLHLKNKVDPWQALIRKLDIPESTILQMAPHFPDVNESDFSSKKQRWINEHLEEVIKLLELPEIKAFNPSHISLGIQGLIPRKEIYHPYWYAFNNPRNNPGEANRLAPHFPKPDRSLPIDKQEKQFKIDLARWINQYPKEFEVLDPFLFNGQEEDETDNSIFLQTQPHK